MGGIQNTKLVELSIEYLAIVCFSRIVNSFNFADLIKGKGIIIPVTLTKRIIFPVTLSAPSFTLVALS